MSKRIPTKIKRLSSKKWFLKNIRYSHICGQALFWMILKISQIGISNCQRLPSDVMFQWRRENNLYFWHWTFLLCLYEVCAECKLNGPFVFSNKYFSTIAQRMFWSYWLLSSKVYMETQLFSQNDCKELNIENKDVCLSL